MESPLDLYRAVRSRFPAVTEKADAEHRRLGLEVNAKYLYLWFESLATALNREMAQGVSFLLHEPLFLFLAGALSAGGREVGECIDVAFVENLFWKVRAEQAQPYWQGMPSTLKELYMAFFQCGPQPFDHA